jgi:hypothetical protein
MLGWILDANAKQQDPVTIPASLFYRDENNGVDGLDFDLMTGESHGIDFTISEHPIENGTSITDHIRIKPRKCSVSGIFSCHPMTANSGFEEGENKALENYLALERLSKKMKAVRLVTDIIIYPKMLIESVSTKRGIGDSEQIKFDMTLREFTEVKLQQKQSEGIVTKKDLNTDDGKTVSQKVNNGKVSGVTVEEQKTIDNFTALRGVIKFQ